MQQKTLAKIDAKRHITHEGGHTVHIHWNEHTFCLSRTDFTDLAQALKDGMFADYADFGAFSVVWVDNTNIEVWLNDVCLHLSQTEYRTLTNAALMTETRLHGFRTTRQHNQRHTVTVQTVSRIRPPRPLRHYEN